MKTRSKNKASNTGTDEDKKEDCERTTQKRLSDDDTDQGLEPPSKKCPSDGDKEQDLEPPSKNLSSEEDNGQGQEQSKKNILSDNDSGKCSETTSNEETKERTESSTDDTMQHPASGETEDITTVSGEIFYVGDVYHYYINGRKCTEFPVILINNTDCYRLRVFNETFQETFSSNCKKTVEIDDIKFKNCCIYVSSKSSIEESASNTVQPSREVKLKAERMKEDFEPSGYTKIGSIKEANARINTKAKIVQMFPKEKRFPVQAYKYIPVYLRTIKIADDTGVVDITLWEDAADRTFENGQILKIEKAFTSSRQDGSVFLTTQAYTDIQVIQKSDPSYDEALDDSVQASSLSGNIEDINEVQYYRACPRCFHKKEGSNMCKWCGFAFKIRAPIIGITCSVSVRIGESFKDITLFNADVRRLLLCMFPVEGIGQSSHMSRMLESHTAGTLRDKMLEGLSLTTSFAVSLTSKGDDAVVVEKIGDTYLHDIYMAL